MWTIRVSVDCLLLLVMAAKDGGRVSLSNAAVGASFIMLAGYLTGPEREWQWRAGIAAVACAVSLLMAWYGVLSREDRSEIGRLRHAH